MEEKILTTRSAMPPFEEYIEMIKPLWDSHWLTNMGQFHRDLEDKLKQFLAVEQASLMVNGHMALEMAIQAMELPAGGEVITTPFTFISTTHAIVRNGLVPVFCDIKRSDFTMDESKIEDLITDKTVAIVPVHVYGNLCAWRAIEGIAKKYNLKVIYDAAHAFGETDGDIGVGNFGDASVFSFHATKTYNTIEGGAVCFTDPALTERLYNLKNFGIRSEETVVSIGANAKMNEFCAAMGLCNLIHFHEETEKRKRIVDQYSAELNGLSGLTCVGYSQEDTRYNYSYYPILCPEYRDKLYEHLKYQNIFTRKYFYPLTADQACFKNRYKKVDLSVAREISSQILVLPLYGDLGSDTVHEICKLVKNTLSD